VYRASQVGYGQFVLHLDEDQSQRHGHSFCVSFGMLAKVLNEQITCGQDGAGAREEEL
jgi:hypothetical protein